MRNLFTGLLPTVNSTLRTKCKIEISRPTVKQWYVTFKYTVIERRTVEQNELKCLRGSDQFQFEKLGRELIAYESATIQIRLFHFSLGLAVF